jgi:hypothetical protein
MADVSEYMASQRGFFMDFSRQEQLDSAAKELQRHADLGWLITASGRTHSAQASHLEGVYAEVDKLTKGKSLAPTSDLLVEIVNSLIADAKELVHRDTYLERLKSFVPAGDNPAYPDVLVALRILQQALGRFKSMLTAEGAEHLEIGGQLKTVCAALEVAQDDEGKFYDEPSSENDEDDSVEGKHDTVEEDSEESDDKEVEESEEDDEEDEDSEESIDDDETDSASADLDEYEECVRESEVQAKLDKQTISAIWLLRSRDGDYYFDFQKLDTVGPPRYVPPAEGITFVAASE